MARQVVLHVGLMKSGTSYVQSVMRANAETLRARGVLFPTPWAKQVQAVRDLAENGGSQQAPLAADGPWHTLMSQVRDWPGTAVISMEFLGPRNPRKIAEVVRTLPAEDLRVVISVRDLARTIPAMWQENVQNWGNLGWDDYLAGIRAGNRKEGPGSGFWQRQDAAAIAARWAAEVGPERVTLLTVPRPGAPAELLWERFASLVDGDLSGLMLDARSNPSLGLPSLVMLARLNQRLRAQDTPITGRQYDRTVKQLLAKRGLAPRQEPKLGYDASWVRPLGDRQIEALAKLGCPVVGDLEELRCADVPGRTPDSVTAEEQLDAALDALALITAELVQARRGDQGARDRGGRGGPGGDTA